MRILIAEDDQVLADGLLRSLRAAGAAVDHVASGSEADAALMTNNEFDLLILDLGLPKMHGLEVLEGIAPDAIISDINMPRLDGFGFMEAVRGIDKHRATPILVLTTESAPELKARARAAGATGWIVKPFDPVKLVKALHMVAG